MKHRPLRRLKRRLLRNQPAAVRALSALGEHCPALQVPPARRQGPQPGIVQVGSLPAKSGFRSA